MKFHGKLKHGLLLFSAVSVVSLFITGTVFSKNEVKLTPEYLASGKWVIPGAGQEGCDGEAKFTTEGRFLMVMKCGNREDWVDASGTYKIDGNKIVFKVEKSIGGLINKGETTPAVLSDKDSLKYRWSISFTDHILDLMNYNSAIKNGDPVSLGGVEAIAMGSTGGIVTTTLKIREAPDTSAKEIDYTSCKNGSPEVTKSIEKGTQLVIYARTKDKAKTGKWNNYWYYVNFPFDDCEGGSNISGWVFGEFVKIK